MSGMNICEFSVSPDQANERLDVAVAEAAGVTRSRAGALIRDGRASVDGAAQTKPGFKLKAGMLLRVEIPEAAPAAAQPEDIDLDIVYQDQDLAVVFKPSGMVVHPAAGNETGTLVNALLAKLDNLSGIGGEIRPGIVHRIDKDTSGLLLVAKNDMAHLSLSEQIKAHTVSRASISVAPRSRSSTVQWVTASRPLGTMAMRFRSVGCRPMGPSTVPSSSLKPPMTMAL